MMVGVSARLTYSSAGPLGLVDDAAVVIGALAYIALSYQQILASNSAASPVEALLQVCFSRHLDF
jgi:hypothetical protein